MQNFQAPTFSVFSVIKNIESRKDQFLRSVQSVLSQSFEDLEFVIQDGASTDATLDIISNIQDSRIVVASEKDSGPEEGFFRALKRCRGSYIASCLSDEELAPGSLQYAFNVFQENPGIAALYGNYGSVNEHGEKWEERIPGNPFTIEDYVCQNFPPSFCASFFSRSHIERAGLYTHQWRYNVGEFEFWIRIAGTGKIIYVPKLLAYFGRHSNSNTANAWLYDILAPNRAKAMSDFFKENLHLKNSSATVAQAIACNYAWAADSVHRIEGPSERYRNFIHIASHFDPDTPRLKKNLSIMNKLDLELIRENILKEYPELALLLIQWNVHAAVDVLRKWTSSILTVSDNASRFVPKDVISSFNIFKDKKYGVWCSGAATFHAMILNLFGIPATTFAYAHPSATDLSHVVTLYALRRNWNYMFYVSDAYFDLNFCDNLTQKPLHLGQLFYRIAKRSFSSIQIQQMPVLRDCIVQPNVNPAIDPATSWYFSESNPSEPKKMQDRWIYSNAQLSPENLIKFHPYWTPMIENHRGSLTVSEFILELILYNPKFGSFGNTDIDLTLKQFLSSWIKLFNPKTPVVTKNKQIKNKCMSYNISTNNDKSFNPYLSIVATSRNDDHGGNLKMRMQVFINALLAQAERHQLPTELLLVDWNPPAGLPALAELLTWPAQHPYCSVRVIEVPPSIHARYKHAESLPLYQMIGKNVGVRRARGAFVLCTNVDIVFSDPLFAFLAKRSLETNTLYRSDRHDTGNDLDPTWSLDRTLDYCVNHLVRLNLRDASINLVTNQRHEVYPPNATEQILGRPILHTNGCGDFTLLSREDWFRLRGYVEWDIYSFHLDSLFLYSAHYGGCREVVLPPDHVHYHIEHCAGWTPEIHNNGILERHLNTKKIERLDNADRKALILDMAARKEPLMANDENWGLAQSFLPIRRVTAAFWESGEDLPADTRTDVGLEVGSEERPTALPGGEADKPYLSIVVTTRNDDHGGNMIQRFQVFLDHLDDMARRHHLPMELIVVEWNPDPGRDPLVDAMDWPHTPCLNSRIITVPPEVHATHEHHDKFPLFQMIAKNVGIRRARGEFVLATNIDLIFSDELFSFLAQRTLDLLCIYRIDRHDIKATTIPNEFSWQERLTFCEQNLIRVQGQYGTYAWGAKPPSGEPERLHTNACGDFSLLSRDMWLRLKGYPEFHLWSIFIDGLLVHAAVAAGLRQVILPDPCRIYHIEHDLGWAKTQAPIAVRPSLDYDKQYLPLCRGMLARGKPLDTNADNWGLTDMQLQETRPGLSQDSPEGKATKHSSESWPYSHWLNVLTASEGRLYYRDQSAASLESLAALVRGHAPTIIVELGTLSGMSTRAWTLSLPNARIHAVDLSFKAFWKANEHFPVDTSRITFHEQNILAMDFKSLWSAGDRVLFFVDAHDLPSVPIMRHVLKNALPHLPKDSLVVVDDIWFSQERLGPDNVQEYFDKFLLGQIDELQCFTGHYAPYHKGGSFMGFREVLPLMEFVNSRGINLGNEPGGKHVWFSWDRERHEHQIPVQYGRHERESGFIEYNPLALRAHEPLASRILPKVARLYQQGQLQESAMLLVDLINKEPSQSACFALAVCQARLGKLDDARKLAQLARQAGGDNWRVNRLADDLEYRVGRPKVRMTGRKGLTIFAVPKAFKGHEAVIQKNAIRSWALLDTKPEIILLGNDIGVREMALEVGARHIPDIATNEFGTPLVDDIFRKAWDVATNDILAYVNADIILMNDFQAAAAKVIEQFPEFLVVGQRWDLPVWEEIDFNSPEWMETLRKDVQENGFLHAETGLDYFIHPRGLWRGMPPFALGRTAWDNWLVKRPFEDEIPIIDGTGFITAVHQDHGYDHCQGGRKGAWKGVEARRNQSIAGIIAKNSYSIAANLAFDVHGSIVSQQENTEKWNTEQERIKKIEWLLQQAKRLEKNRIFHLAIHYSSTAAELASL